MDDLEVPRYDLRNLMIPCQRARQVIYKLCCSYLRLEDIFTTFQVGIARREMAQMVK
jgi:hypothetical protein